MIYKRNIATTLKNNFINIKITNMPITLKVNNPRSIHNHSTYPQVTTSSNLQNILPITEPNLINILPTKTIYFKIIFT